MKQLLFIFIALFALCTRSQIRYSKESLAIDSRMYTTDYDFNIGLPGGLLLNGSNPNRSFKIHIPSFGDGRKASPCLFGNSVISFYYDIYGMKVWIFCREIFTMSDERHKTDIRNMDSALYRVVNPPKQRMSVNQYSSASSQMDMGLSYMRNLAPNSVIFAENDTLINYNEIIPVLVKAIQEMSAESAQLDDDIKSVKLFLQAKKGQQSKYGKILSCQPNPTISDVATSYELYLDLNKPTISLINSSGVPISTVDLIESTGAISIPLNKYPSGIYYLVLTNGGVALDSYRIIKQ